ncbi:MAG: flagellar motor switch protein FliG [Treponema bryantii]|nr:flagellar motor switch protein FliG [Treponema bryantii]
MNLNDMVKNAYSNAAKSNDNSKKSESSPELQHVTDYLKTGGLIKVTQDQTEQKDSIFRRVAKFLLIIGEDEAAKILPHLSEAQIEKIIPEIASIRSVNKDEADSILAEFNSLLQNARQAGGVETAREMLTKVYGKEKANQMLEKTVPFSGARPFDYLSDSDSERIYILLKDENIGVQAMVLSHLQPQKAASVINQMNPEEKKEIVLRLAKMEAVSPDILKRVDRALREKSLRQTSQKAEKIDGKNALAQILKKMSPSAENDIIASLSASDPDLGMDLRSRLFTMEDVINADDRFIQEQLRLLDDQTLCLLIAANPDDFRNKILDNVSSTRRQDVLSIEEINKPFRRSDCERVTSEFFATLRRAYEDGKLIIHGRDEDFVN